ncbi:uncharacterized protein LOC143234168 [Tachypleus tridentatus]|uniref:uncharacterized protein LOC143234168 n=1 Tax=Tachypleus tridentatus TaxID=6853 RepID=UPI003FD02059
MGTTMRSIIGCLLFISIFNVCIVCFGFDIGDRSLEGDTQLHSVAFLNRTKKRVAVGNRHQVKHIPSHKAFHQFHFQPVRIQHPERRLPSNPTRGLRPKLIPKEPTSNPKVYPISNRKRMIFQYPTFLTTRTIPQIPKSTPKEQPKSTTDPKLPLPEKISDVNKLVSKKPHTSLPSHEAFHDFHFQLIKLRKNLNFQLRHSSRPPTSPSVRRVHTIPKTQKHLIKKSSPIVGSLKTKRPITSGLHNSLPSPISKMIELPGGHFSQSPVRVTAKPRIIKLASHTSLPPHKAFHKYHFQPVRPKPLLGRPLYKTSTPNYVLKATTPAGSSPSVTDNSSTKHSIVTPITRKPESTVVIHRTPMTSKSNFPPHKAFHQFHFQPIRIRPLS